MTEEALRYVFDQCIEAYNRKIVRQFTMIISGGEPLLEFKMFSEVLPYYIENYQHIFRFGMTTNITILNEEIIDWFKKYKLQLACSIDSLIFSKPVDGISSSKLQLMNVKMLKEAGIEAHVLSVYHSQTDNEMMEFAKYAVKNFAHWKIMLCKPPMHSKDQILKMVKPIIKFLYDNNYHRNFDLDSWFFWDKRMAGRTACCCGRHLFGISPDLIVCPNNEVPFINLGNFTYDIQSFIDHPDNIYYKNDWRPRICDNCELKHLCDGACRLGHKNIDLFKDRCDAIKEILTYINSFDQSGDVIWKPTIQNNYSHSRT